LSRKLEVQTQRLELLTAQNMVNENISEKQPDSRATYENIPYADEGDEVTYMYSLCWSSELVLKTSISSIHSHVLSIIPVFNFCNCKLHCL
jgi:hypothetical protein